MFVDQQREPGQRLHSFAILGETTGSESYRQFVVRLWLEQPEATATVSYYVFGQGPIWVYRAEDFDMIMHMDKSMMPASPETTDSVERVNEPVHAPEFAHRAVIGSNPVPTSVARPDA